MPAKPKHVLPLIVLAQFAGTSLWFTGNAVLPELKKALDLDQYAISLVTAAVMIGFVAGTLVFAIFSLADRFSPVRLFFICSCCGAICNLLVAWLAHDGATLFLFRFLTGFFLAGIYPVGMKIAADWFEKGLGHAMGFLLGALVLGTAFPHLLKNRDFDLPWKTILYCTSAFAFAGGLLLYFFVGDGPYRKRAGRFRWDAIPRIFRSLRWRQTASGYFGHMWELYTFWGFIPVIISLYAEKNAITLNIPLLSFLVIGSGSLSCIAGGFVSRTAGSAKVATISLLISGLCCLLSPLIFSFPLYLFLGMIFTWGMTVVPDSPQFSSLVAQYAPDDLRGTALTIYNSIGFTISTISLWVIDRVFHSTGFMGGANTFILLGAGAIAGLPPMFRLLKREKK